MPWIRVSVGVPGADAEAVGEALEALGAVAVTWLDDGNPAIRESAILEPAPDAPPDLAAWPEACAAGLFPLDADLAPVRVRFEGRPLRVDFVSDADWSARWRRDLEPRRFGTLTIAPSHAPLADLRGAVLRLDPGAAFGAGGHATTRLCLAWLASLPLAGRSVLDFGCGSGILALAAKLRGAERVVAVDHDALARDVAGANALRNGLDIAVCSSDAFEEGWSFDVVVSNILAGTLVAEAPRLRSSLSGQGRVALSGVLEEQVDDVMAAYPEVVFDAPRRMDGWMLLSGRWPATADAP